MSRAPFRPLPMMLPLLACLCSAAPPGPGVRVQAFDADPGWDGYRNRLEPPRPHVVRQQFGYRASNKAGGAKAGEIGGRPIGGGSRSRKNQALAVATPAARQAPKAVQNRQPRPARPDVR